jgi:hypothetical protein
MIPVNPNKRTTLLLNRHYLSYGRFCTARRAIQLMIKGRAKGIDASGAGISWTGADIDNLNGTPSEYSWSEKNVQLYPDQPSLRSAPNPLTGAETMWPVPTILVCTRHIGIPERRGSSVSLRTLYNLSKGVCEYCGDKIPFAEATKDHVYPRSLGGSNDDFNLVLACRRCNSKKGASYPHYKPDGTLPEGVTLHSFLSHMYEGMDIRPEMEPYLYQR